MLLSKCRFCDTPLEHTFVDLGMSPISNAFVSAKNLNNAEKFYPLHAYVCQNCLLVQLEEFESPAEIFNGDYAYFSSYSQGWLKHAKKYTDFMVERFGFNEASQVIEIASNDGYLLQYFKEKNIPVLGIEPAANVAEVAEAKGITSLVKFFSVETASELAKQGKQADLLLGNNVLAHVPNLNDFVAGMQIILKPQGIITMEFPHVLRLIESNQFDTIYHEHFSYLSFLTVEKVFASHGITLFDVEELPTHGGSLRIYGKHQACLEHPISSRVELLKSTEIAAGIDKISNYLNFSDKVQLTKRKLLSFLLEVKNAGKLVVGYGAPAKGNTLLNYSGVKTDLLKYTVDLSSHKQGLFLPGTHIPVYHPDRIRETKPDYVLILPWNIKEEVMTQMADVREWGGKFVVPIPQLEVLA
jgi:2-polyprenyl-3-methyl-5-hydroxy-6-metoxy-1,4-benzoquinol methylase